MLAKKEWLILPATMKLVPCLLMAVYMPRTCGNSRLLVWGNVKRHYTQNSLGDLKHSQPSQTSPHLSRRVYALEPNVVREL